jgi:hypothetical protein
VSARGLELLREDKLKDRAWFDGEIDMTLLLLIVLPYYSISVDFLCTSTLTMCTILRQAVLCAVICAGMVGAMPADGSPLVHCDITKT